MATITRRESLVKLAAGALGTVFAPAAGIERAKAGKKARKNANLRCRRQIPGCEQVVREGCRGTETQCAALPGCCANLGTCNVTGFFDCLIEVAMQP
jgi:hypothetical protein